MAQWKKNEWITKEGQVLTPRQMETSHIVNILNMLARRAQKIIADRAQLHALAGHHETAKELALMALDDEQLREWCLSHHPIAIFLEAELERRAGQRYWGAEY